jgi:hypothetical protein
MENIVQNIQRIKVDSLYGKKKHFNAAERKQRIHFWIGIPLMLLNIISTSVIFYVITENVTGLIKYTPLIIALITTILAGFQTFLNIEKSVEGHKRVGNKYLSIMKKCNRLESIIKDRVFTNDEIIQRFETISNETDEINIEAESFSTNNSDYKKAKKGIENGEESYTIDELNL